MNIKVIYRLFAAELLAQAVAIYTVSTIMFSERSGLNAGQIGIVLGTFSVTTLLFEIPTGVLADTFSRKWSMVVARLLLAAGLLCWLLFPFFKGYLIGMVLMGIAESLMSGALQAYLYESLGEDRKLFNKYNARLWSVMMTGWMLGSAIAAVLGPRYALLLVLSALMPLASAALAATLPNETINASQETTTLTLITGAARYIKNSRKLVYAFFTIVTMKALVDVLIEYIPLYYKTAGAPTRVVPILFLVGNFITIFLFWHSQALTKLLKRQEYSTGLLFLLVFIASRYFGTVPAVAGIFIYVRYVRIMFVHLESEFQHMAVNKYRATLGSLYSMGARLIAAASFVLIGYFSKKTSLLTPILVFSALLYTAHRVTYALSDRYAPKVNR